MFSWDCHTTRSASMLFLHIVDIYPLFTVDLSIPWTLRDHTWSVALFLTTFQLTSCKEVLHILWRVSSLTFQANRSWIGGLTLCVNRIFVDCIDRSLSSQPGHFTIQTWNSFWKPLHPFCRSLSLPKVDLLTVVESEEAFTQSSIELFTFPLLILTSCFVISLVTSSMNSRPGSTWRTFGHLSGPRLEIFGKALETWNLLVTSTTPKVGPGYALVQANKSARWLASSAKALYHLQAPRLL